MIVVTAAPAMDVGNDPTIPNGDTMVTTRKDRIVQKDRAGACQCGSVFSSFFGVFEFFAEPTRTGRRRTKVLFG